MGKKPIVSVAYEDERISTKNSLPYIKCVLHLSRVHGSWADLWPFYGLYCRRFSLSILYIRLKTVYSTTHEIAVNRPMDHTGEK